MKPHLQHVCRLLGGGPVDDRQRQEDNARVDHVKPGVELTSRNLDCTRCTTHL